MANSCFGSCWTCCNSTFVEDHEHPLSFIRNPRALYKCDGCKEIGSGPSYKCVERSCNYQLHRECKDLSSADGSTATHSLFSRNTVFIFHKESPDQHVGSCVACGKAVQGFRYHYSPPEKNACLECFLPTKPRVLHPCCFNLPSTKTHEGMNLQLNRKAPSKCLICHRKKISKEIKGWAYVSTCGNGYCCHVKCAKEPVDKKFEHQSDRSSLKLEVKRKALKVGTDVGKEIIKAVLMLILSAIFGDPISAIVNLL